MVKNWKKSYSLNIIIILLKEKYYFPISNQMSVILASVEYNITLIRSTPYEIFFIKKPLSYYLTSIDLILDLYF